MDNNYNHNTEEKSFTVHDLPLSERPRERMMSAGPKALSSLELIALILGKGIKGESVMVTSQKLLSHFGSLKNVLNSSLEDLTKIRGLGPAKATQLLACFEIARRIAHEEMTDELNRTNRESVKSPDAAVRLIRSEITDFSKENFFVLSFDTRNKLIGIDRISQGTLNASLVHPRETFESAIRKHAAQIMIAHNHPSGSTEPSEEDIKITKRLHEAGKIMGIELIDHIIVTRNHYLSFMEKGLL
jgi:DNA repair protein RadC